MEGRHRHRIARPARALRRLHVGRPGAEQLRRRPHHGRRPRGPRPRTLRVRSRRRRCLGPGAEPGGRVVHDRGRHRRPPLRRATSSAWPPEPSSAWPARGPPTTTAAAITRSPSRPPPSARTGRPRPSCPSDASSPLFQAALETTEEAVYNSLLRATSVTSALGSAEALPIGRLIDVMRRYGRPASF